MKYSQVLFKAKSNYYYDMAKGATRNWDFTGYIFPLNALKFDSKIIIISINNC